MKIVKLKGGLGNQLFQYTFALYLSRLVDDDIKLDFSVYELENVYSKRKPDLLRYNIVFNMASNEEIRNFLYLDQYDNKFLYKSRLAFNKLFNPKYFYEKRLELVNNEIINKYSYFEGYWQNWKYVDSVINEVKSTINIELSQHMLSKVKMMNDCNSVFVGIRRGDYVNTSSYVQLTTQYYTNAMKLISERERETCFFIFSDDIDWVKKNCYFGKYNCKFMDCSDDANEELVIMSKCKHAIISNSTFHWWAARLIASENSIIIAPQKWYSDQKAVVNIIPPDWIVL